MKIDDNWFTNTMLANILSHNKNVQSQTSSSNIINQNPFAKIFTELLTELGADSSEQTQAPSIVPNLLSTIDYLDNSQNHVSSQNTEIASAGSLRFQSRSTELLNQGLKGALAGKGETLLRAGKLYNLDPALLTAIAKHESGNGESRAANVKNNIAGMMGSNGLKSYASVDDSIMDMARNISKNYLGQGLSSITEIGAKYAPIGASNDPTGLNNHWVNGVTKYFNQLTLKDAPYSSNIKV